MAEVFDMSVLGLEMLEDFLKECDKNEAKLIRKATIAGARKVLREARRRCPKGDYQRKKTYLGTYRYAGNLAKSLKIKACKPIEKGKQLVIIGPEVGKKAKHDGWYGRLVEDGHKTVKATGTYWSKRVKKILTKWEYGGSDVEPKAFLRPAFDDKQNEAYNEMARVYGNEWGNKTIADDIDTLGEVIAESLGGG